MYFLLVTTITTLFLQSSLILADQTCSLAEVKGTVPAPVNQTLSVNRTLSDEHGLIVCPNLGNGTCCNEDDLRGLSRTFNSSKTTLFKTTETLRHGIDARLKYYTSLTKDLELQLECQMNNNVTGNEIVKLNKAVETLRNVSTVLPNNYYQCTKAGMRFKAGYLCLKCQPDASLFIENDTDAIILHQDTCTAIENKCGPLFKSLDKYLSALKVTLNAIPYQLRKDDLSRDLQEEKIEDFPEKLCLDENTCDEGLCQSLPIEGGEFDFKTLAAPFMKNFFPARQYEINQRTNKTCQDLWSTIARRDSMVVDTQKEIRHAQKVAAAINRIKREGDNAKYVYSENGYETIKTGSAASFDLMINTEDDDIFEGVTEEVKEEEEEEEEEAKKTFSLDDTNDDDGDNNNDNGDDDDDDNGNDDDNDNDDDENDDDNYDTNSDDNISDNSDNNNDTTTVVAKVSSLLILLCSLINVFLG